MTQKITVEADDAMKVIIARLLGTTDMRMRQRHGSAAIELHQGDHDVRRTVAAEQPRLVRLLHRPRRPPPAHRTERRCPVIVYGFCWRPYSRPNGWRYEVAQFRGIVEDRRGYLSDCVCGEIVEIVLPEPPPEPAAGEVGR